MGNGASLRHIPVTEEEALREGYTREEIDAYLFPLAGKKVKLTGLNGWKGECTGVEDGKYKVTLDARKGEPVFELTLPAPNLEDRVSKTPSLPKYSTEDLEKLRAIQVDECILTGANREPVDFLISKFSAQVYDVDTHIARIRLGDFPRNKEFPEGLTLKIVTNDVLLLHDDRVPKWEDEFLYYGNQTKHGVLVLAPTETMFQNWVSSGPCQRETAQFPPSRVWILTNDGIWHRGGAKDAAGNEFGQTYFGERDPDTQAFNGYGTAYYTNNDKYSGDWDMGVQSGTGCYTYANGDYYTGNFANDMKHGVGTARYSVDEGGFEIYTGEYEKDLKHGIGTYKYADGLVEVGTYVLGNIVGESVVWAKDRSQAFRMLDGEQQDEPISLEEAEAFAKAKGVDVPT